MKKFFIKSLALLNGAEGVIHLTTSVISFWGIADTGAWDWRIMTAPTADFFLGLVSLVTGFVLNNYSHRCGLHIQRCPNEPHEMEG